MGSMNWRNIGTCAKGRVLLISSGLKEDVVKAGVMLGIGITNANVRDTFNVPYGYAMDNMNPEATPLLKQVTAFSYASFFFLRDG